MLSVRPTSVKGSITTSANTAVGEVLTTTATASSAAATAVTTNSSVVSPKKILQAQGLSADLITGLLSQDANVTHAFAKQPVSLVHLAQHVVQHLASLPSGDGSDPVAAGHTRARAACAAACAYHLGIGNGIAFPSLHLGRILAKLIHDDVGGYASGEQRDLVEVATAQASGGHTHGHDCFFQSTGSITNQRPEAVGDALGIHTSGYQGEDRSGKWNVGANLQKLGYQHERLGQVFEDVKFGKPRVLPDMVGFFGDGALEEARAAMLSHDVGSRFILHISGHYLHAVRAHDGVHFLDSQTTTGETLIVPLQVLQANRDKFRGAEVTKLLHTDPNAIHTPTYRQAFPKSFLQLCPFAWEPAAV
jgi:hypothetical protein